MAQVPRARSRSVAPACPTTSPPACATSPVRSRRGSPARASASKAATSSRKAPYLEVARAQALRRRRDRRRARRPHPRVTATRPDEPEPVMDHYLVISSDCHAGPETPDYRRTSTRSTTTRSTSRSSSASALIAQMREQRGSLSMGGDDEFQEEWFGHEEGEESLHEGGLRCGWDAPKRDKELDNDGVAGEVIFPDADAATGSMGAPFGAGLVIDADLDPELDARGRHAPTTAGCAELCSALPRAAQGPRGRADPRRRRRRGRGDPARARVRAARRRAHPRDVGRRTRRTRTTSTTRCGRCARSCTCRCTPTPVPARTRTTAPARASRDVRHRDPLVDGATAVVPALLGRVRAVPGAAVRGHRGR